MDDYLDAMINAVNAIGAKKLAGRPFHVSHEMAERLTKTDENVKTGRVVRTIDEFQLEGVTFGVFGTYGPEARKAIGATNGQ